MESNAAILRLPQVMSTTGLSRSSIYLAVKRGLFPQAIPLTPGGRSKGWLKSEVEGHIKAMMDRRAEATT